MITPAAFRTQFPEFQNQTTYPDTTINAWIPWAYLMLNAQRFGNVLDLAAMYWVAHELALEAQALRVAQAGGVPGQVTGPINSKSVDKVSLGYDTSTASEAGAGYYGLTTYGMRLWRMIKMYCNGPVYRVPTVNTYARFVR